MPARDFHPETRIDQNKARRSRQSKSFPENLDDIYITLGFTEYSYQAATSRSNVVGIGSDNIKLPLPQQLQDSAGINVGPAELGASAALAVDVLGTGQGASGIDNLNQAIKDAGLTDNISISEAGDLVSKAGSAVKYFSRATIDSAFQGAGLALDVINGSAVNPHATLNFDGVNLKQYSFNWQLAPQNESESKRIEEIVRTINYHIHPEYESLPGGTSSLNRALLKYPSLVTIRLIGLSGYMEFKYPMMVQNFSVDYSSQGNAILKGGRPAFVNLSMTLQETKIHTRGEYGG